MQLHILKACPIQGNPDSGIRENFACGMWNPGLWTLEPKESGILLRIGIQNPSYTDNDWSPASRGRVSSFIGKTVPIRSPEAECTLCGRDLALKKVKLSALPSAIE